MSAQKLIAAETMGRAVRLDPQFAMPCKPSFPRELVVVPLPDGLLISGTGEQQVLRGRATRSLIPRLLPLLDGTRTLDEVSAALADVPRSLLENAIALLYTRGLLGDGAAVGTGVDPERIDPQVQAFFHRYIDVTRVNRSAMQAFARLAATRVSIYASGPHAAQVKERIRAHLEGAGVREVESLEWGCWPQGTAHGDQRQLIVVLIEGQEDQSHLQELDDICARLRIPWLRVAVDVEAGIAEVGPYFERDETACYHCFSRTALPYRQAQQRSVSSEHARCLQAHLWAAMLAVEAIYLISRISTLATGLNVARYDLASWSMEQWRLPKLPGCSRCRPAPVAMGMIEPAVVYEDAVSFPSRHLLDPKAHQMHYRASNLELAHEGKRYPSAEHIGLPAGNELVRPAGATLALLPGGGTRKNAQRQPLDLRRLATLLLLSAGIRYNSGKMEEKLQRWAPTGGNLGSVELYVAARTVAGLEAGLYFYQPHEHRLARVGQDPDGDLEVTQLMRETLVLEDPEVLPDAVIILTGALHRVAHKYGPFAYRIVHLDAGVALAQMHAVASALGLAHCTLTRIAEQAIARHLDLEDVNEVVTGACALRGSREGEEEQA
jgi:bacteriocin biosynthesis cyclodehydratase domain-containing protein